MKIVFQMGIFLFFIISELGIAHAGQVGNLVCGDAEVIITVPVSRKSPESKNDANFLIDIKNKNRSVRVSCTAENEFLFVRCQKDKDRKDMVVVNNICGGSGCSGSNWGIIDPSELKVILTPNARWKGNHDKAEKIMGVHLKPFSCKSYDGKQPNGEYCFVICFD